jgi:hypothetical protein
LTKEQEQKNNSHALRRPWRKAIRLGGKKNFEIIGFIKI